MPVWGTGPRRTDGKTNFQINATILYVSSPNLISNLSFWFDATDNTTIDLQRGNSSNIYGWRSKGDLPILISTAATVAPAVPNNAVVPYIVPNGLNGKQTVFFSGISSILMTQSTCRFNAIATNNETTIFTVVNPTNNGTVFAYENYFGNRCSYTLGGFFYGNYLYNTVNANGGTNNIGYYQQTFYKRNSDSNQVIKFRGSLNNSGTNTLSMTANQTFALGGIPGGIPAFPLFNPGNLLALTGNIGEVLLYNRGLTDDEIVSVEGYLAKKWGIQNQLQFNHVGVARNRPLMGYRFLSYPQVVSNYGLWFDAMDTSTIRDIGGNFPPLLPPNRLGIGRWNDKSANNRFLSNWVETPSDFNLLATNNYPAVVQRFLPGNAFSPKLRSQDSNNYYIGCNISAFFVLSVQSNNFNDPLLAFSSSFNAMPEPLTGNRLITNSNSTFDFTLTFNSSNIGLSRFGANTINNVVSAPYNGAYSLVSILVNGTQNSIGNVLPSTNVISINGTFVSSSSFYAGNNFNIQYLSIFGGYNFSTRNIISFNEIGIFYRTLTTTERVAYESQLIKKWALPSNAPISYINNNPVTSGLFGWYDAYDQTTVLRNSSNNVSMWLDKSGQNNHMSTLLCQFGSNTGSNLYYSSITTSTNQLPCLYFPSTFAIMRTSTSITNQSFSTFSIFTVGNYTKIPNGPTSRIVAYNSTINANDDFNLTINNANTRQNSNMHLYTSMTNITSNTINSVTPFSTIIYFNTISTLVTGTPSSNINLNIVPSNIRLMGGGITNTPSEGDLRNNSGYLSEVLLYNRILNVSEQLNVNTYLLNKWGISTVVSNVPVTSGLNLWLDCYDPTAVTTDTNSNVLLWRDKSLFGYHMSNRGGNVGRPTYTTNPTGLPSILFDITNNTNAGQGLVNSNIFISSISSITIFVAKQYVNPTATTLSQIGGVNYATFLMGLSTPTFGAPSIGASEFGMYDNNGNATYFNRSTINNATQWGFTNNNNTNLLLTTILNSSTTPINDIKDQSIGFVLNGNSRNVNFIQPPATNTDAGTTSTINTRIISIGNNNGGGFNNSAAYNGYINEVLYYNRALNFSERQQVESYLISKWRI